MPENMFVVAKIETLNCNHTHGFILQIGNEPLESSVMTDIGCRKFGSKDMRYHGSSIGVRDRRFLSINNVLYCLFSGRDKYIAAFEISFQAVNQSKRESSKLVTFNSTKGSISSHPLWFRLACPACFYPVLFDMTFIILVRRNYTILLSFKNFNLEDQHTQPDRFSVIQSKCSDYVQLFTIESNIDFLHWSYCGVKRIKSALFKKPLKLKFHSGTAIGYSGVNAIYTILPSKIAHQIHLGASYNCSTYYIEITLTVTDI